MDGIKNIEISNFRGIEHLKVEDFARVNILVGQNNCGKSTVLEALFLLMGMSNPDLPLSLNKARTRNFRIAVFPEIRYQFYNLNLDNYPEFSSEQYDGINRHLQIRLKYDEGVAVSDISSQGQGVHSNVDKIPNTLEMLFDITGSQGTKHFRSSLSVNQADVISRQEAAKDYVENNFAVLYSSDLSSSNLSNDLSELFKRKQKDILLNLLQKFDDRITAIEILNSDVYIGYSDVKEMLPASMSGDGLRRFLNIVAGAANPLNTAILIDEIDNGLHYSAYKKLWEAIFALAVSTNKQIFVTTHSKETLQKLNEMLGEHTDYCSEMALYTLEQTKLKGHQAYRLPYEGLAEACENNVEIRSIAI